MSDGKNLELQNILLMIKIDAKHLFNRIFYRKKEYIRAMAVKRSRKHFEEIFRTKYLQFAVMDLKMLNADTIVNIEEFYNMVFELKWYLDHTEEMPGTIEKVVDFKINIIQKIYDSLCIYLEAENC